jgi:hypothetical protein
MAGQKEMVLETDTFLPDKEGDGSFEVIVREMK